MRRTKKAEGHQICANLLSDGAILDIIKSFRRLVEASYGPHGRLKFLQTCAGGHVTVTSSSSQIVNHLIGTSHPVLRIILMAVKGHLDRFGDGGLTMAILITRLVESSVKLDVPRSVIVEVLSDAQDIITRYLTSDTCRWRMKVNIGDMKTMLCLAKGVLGTKPVCRLSEKEQDFLSTVLIKAFLQSVPSPHDSYRTQSLNPIQFLTCERCPLSDTKIINGVLIEAPELPTYNLNSAVRNLKVALYNVSMAGDTDEWIEGVTPVAMGGLQQDDLSKGVLELIKGVALMLVKEGVGLVACQKVIHPALKTFFREKGIYVMDRLSVLHIGSVQRLTGATILSTFTSEIPSRWFGHVGSIEHTVINNKSYLHLLPDTRVFLSSQSSKSESVLKHSPSPTELTLSSPSSQSLKPVTPSSLSQSVQLPSLPSLQTHLPTFSSSSSSSPRAASSSRDPSSPMSRHSLRSQPPTPLSPQSSPNPSLRQPSSPSQNQNQQPANSPPPSCPVTTMILCAPDETCVNELKIVCQSVISILQGIVSSPYVVPGGGCLVTHLAWFVRSTARNCDDSCLGRLGCTKAQYIIIMDSVASCLEAVARCLDHDGGDHVVDSANHHHWILAPGDVPSYSAIPSCMCGLVSRDDCENWCMLGNDDCNHVKEHSSVIGGEMCFQDNILDLHLAKVTLLQAAFETASVILRVKHFVSD